MGFDVRKIKCLRKRLAEKILVEQTSILSLQYKKKWAKVNLKQTSDTNVTRAVMWFLCKIYTWNIMFRCFVCYIRHIFFTYSGLSVLFLQQLIDFHVIFFGHVCFHVHFSCFHWNTWNTPSEHLTSLHQWFIFRFYTFTCFHVIIFLNINTFWVEFMLKCTSHPITCY